MRIHWHRRDLRLPDNRGLQAATGNEPIVPVFVVDEDVHEFAGSPRIAFVLDALCELRSAYRRRESDLLVRRGDPETVLPDLAATLGADGVHACRDYSAIATERDAAVQAALPAGVDLHTHHDAVLVPPGEITTTQGEPYSVFSYYADKWHARDPLAPVAEPPAAALADRDELAGVDPGPIPDLQELCVDEPEASIPAAGTAVARDLLHSFLEGPIYEYDELRDYPAAGGTSRLSPHLRFGTIGVRAVYEATERAAAEAPDQSAREGVREFQEQLAWRDFYTERLATDPEMVASNVTSFENPIEWRRDEADFTAWTRGQTGYPIVDAGMRQLRREAWIHNRVRMIVASFLTKDLRIDWRWGYAWFREKLVDHDPANNAGGWQWAASTGTDAQPFFRVFNPGSQAETHDPDGEYVREYVPELRDVPTEAIHEWPGLAETERCRLAAGYPSPIVDHADAREAALAMFRRARGEDPE